METNIAHLGKAFANAHRYRIFKTVCRRGKTNVTDIIRAVKLPQPAVSQHLKTLKNCHLVVYTRRGKEMIYAANVQHLESLCSAIHRDLSLHPAN